MSETDEKKPRHNGPAEDRYVNLPVRVWRELHAAGIAPPSPSPSTLYVWLWSSALSLRVPGVIPAGKGAIADELGWSTDEVEGAIAPLVDAGLVVVDWTARIVYLPDAMKRQCSFPNGPPTAVMWRREIMSLQPCELAQRIDNDVREMLAKTSPALAAIYDANRRIDTAPRVGNPVGNPVGNRVPISGSGSGSCTSTSTPASQEMAAAPRPKVRRKAADRVRDNAKTKSESKLPYSFDEFQKTLATSGYYTPATTPTEKLKCAAYAVIKAYSLEDVRLVADWHKAGGDEWKRKKQNFDIRSIYLSEFGPWVDQARKWAADGRPPIVDERSTHAASPGRGNVMPHVAVGGEQKL
jgi:hypothetical protein